MVALAAAAAVAASMGEFALKQGDRVVFYGDSITEHQRYSAYVEAFVRTRLPKLNISFIGAGWAGDTVLGGSPYWSESGGPIQERIQKDVAPRRPTLITVMLGMNDAYYSPYKQEWMDQFMKDYRTMLDLMTKAAPQARFTLLSPSPWDDFTRPPSFPPSVKGEGGYNASLALYGKAIESEAAARQHGFIDVNAGLADALIKAAAEDRETAQKLISDWIHPDWPGALSMAAVMLRGWNAPPNVTHVEIDLATARGKAQGAKVRGIESRQWEQQDLCLPFPYDPSDRSFSLAARSSGLAESLDRQTLKVKGLPDGTWRLRIDGIQILDASSLAFGEGISLSGFKTPMRGRSLEILELVKLKNRLQQARWREVERGALGSFAEARGAVRAMTKLEEGVVRQIRAITSPRWSRWTLTPLDSP
jgi:lysophospholipase L1-like esterase